MKKLYLFLAFLCLVNLSFSQLRMAILGGPHTASVKEENSIPSWETQVKPGYSSRQGLNLGILVDIPLSSNSTRWFLQPGIMYMSKGRKYYKSNDTLTSLQTDTISASHNLSVNYIDIPFNLTYKMPLGKNAKFILSAGPYVGFFYSGKQTFATRIYSSNSFKDDEVKLETGKSEGKMKTFNAGFNARAGFELGNVMLTGFISEGLTNFYTASYEGTFKHRVRGISLGFWLNRVKQPPASSAKTFKDSDKDGVPDNIDECPKLAGSAITKGCPDKDEDGIADKNDKCPDVAGVWKYNGCPAPDTDGDGVNDDSDACPYEKGVMEFNGCPEPIKKELQEKVLFASKNILFKAGSDQLIHTSSDALGAVVDVLKTNPKLKLSIEGHTDSTGSYELNRDLSQKRAESVKKYLIEKGIDESRLLAKGFGSSKPLVSNETLASRRKNRRVELKLVQ